MALASVVLQGLGFGAWVSRCMFYKLQGSNPYRAFWGSMLVCGVYLEGQGDLVSRLITSITHIVTPIIPIINLVTKSP